MAVTFEDFSFAVYGTDGAPLAGLTPSWLVCLDMGTGLATTPPTVTGLGGGLYSVPRSTTKHLAGILDFGASASPRYQLVDSPISASAPFALMVCAESTGAPLAGLTPSWLSLVDVETGAPAAQPAVTDRGFGLYSVPNSAVTRQHLSGMLDFGALASPRFFAYDAITNHVALTPAVDTSGAAPAIDRIPASIAHIADHVERAKARLVTQFRETASHGKMVELLTSEVQVLEDAIFSILSTASIDLSSGAQLDRIGKVLGCARDAHTDAQYRVFLKAQILANRSMATAPELLTILETILAAYNANDLELVEWYPAAFILRIVDAIGTVEPAALARVLHVAHDAGNRCLLEWTGANDDHTFSLCADADVDGSGNGPTSTTQGLAGPVAIGDGAQAGASSFTSDAAFDLVALGFTAPGSVVITDSVSGESATFAYSTVATHVLGGLVPSIPADWTSVPYAVPASGGVLAGIEEA